MTIKRQKIISAVFISAATLGGFEALAYILNLNQIGIFLHAAFWIFCYLLFKTLLLFDLHFKNPGSLLRARLRHQNVANRFERSAKIWLSALLERFEHVRNWRYFSLWLHYCILPGLVFWATLAIFYVNAGRVPTQQVFIFLSASALTVNFWYLKEIFHRRNIKVDRDIFIPLSVVKIYASFLVYYASFVLIKRHCLSGRALFFGLLLLTFSLIYQALFQHRQVNKKNLAVTFLISAFMGVSGYFVISFWSYNFLTAAVFLTALYNFCWGIFHYHLDRAMTWHSFWEILLVTLAVAAMIFSATNFKAKILPDCVYGREFFELFR